MPRDTVPADQFWPRLPGTVSATCKTCRWWAKERAVTRDEAEAWRGEGYDLYYGEDSEPSTNTMMLPPWEYTTPVVIDGITHGGHYPLPPFAVGECRSPKLVHLRRPQTLDGASVIDGEDYSAALYTGPDFGCIHHEATDV